MYVFPFLVLLGKFNRFYSTKAIYVHTVLLADDHFIYHGIAINNDHGNIY